MAQTDADDENIYVFPNKFTKLFDYVFTQNKFTQLDSTISITNYKFKYSKTSQTNNGENVQQTIEVVIVPLSKQLVLCYATVQGKENEIKLKLKLTGCRRDISKLFQSNFVNRILDLIGISIDDLPLELKLKIVKYLPPQDIVSLSSASKEWRQTCLEDDQLWQKQYFAEFRHTNVPLQRRSDESWYESFKKAWQARRQERQEAAQFEASRRRYAGVPRLPGPFRGPPHMFPFSDPNYFDDENDGFFPYFNDLRPRNPDDDFL